MLIVAAMTFGPGQDPVLPGTAGRDRGAARARAGSARSLPDSARARRSRARVRPRNPDDHATAGRRAGRDPTAASLLGSVLHVAPRPAAKHHPDLGACDRSRRRDDGGCRGGCPLLDSSPRLGSRVRPGRDRLADGSARSDGDRAPARRSAGGPSRSSRARASSTTERRSCSTGSLSSPSSPGRSRSGTQVCASSGRLPAGSLSAWSSAT
jgi:hypothetical protein